MTIRVAPRIQRVALLATLLALPSALSADSFERTPSFAASKIPGIKPVGVNYTVKDPVRSDGLLRVYAVATPYGDINVHGDHMMRMRINELRALDELEKLSQSDQFGQALVNAGLSPVKYAGKLIVDPVKTIGDTFAGVGSFLGGVSSGIANAGKTQDDPLGGLLGVNKERRALAAKLGVDPYTDFPPLAARLQQLSEAAAMGGLAVTGAMMAIPGAAGIVVSNLATANRLGDMRIEELARSYTASQILDLNRQRLTLMGVDQGTAERLLANRNYTPIDLAAMVAALDRMAEVRDRSLFVENAAGANTRAIAYFKRVQAEMMASHHAKAGSFARFVSLGGYPFNVTRDGVVVGVMPFDALSWTQATARALGDSSADMKRVSRGGHGELRFSGQATSLAKQRLNALGWRVVENARI